MADHKSLTEALAAVQANLPVIVKGDEADTGKFSYRYANLTDVSRQLLPLLAEHGLAFVCAPTVDTGGFVLAWQLRHVGGETLDGSWPLPAGGTPQQQGSAISYGRRYCLLAVTGAAPDDDDDGAAASTAKPAAVKAAARKASQPVDLSVLEELIDEAMRLGVLKDWDALRTYAGQSEAHRDKACDKVARSLETDTL